MKRLKVIGLILLIIVPLAALIYHVKNTNFQVLNPKGQIALQEKNLIVFALALSLFVLVPVFLMLIVFAIRYNEKNTKSKYSPNFDHSRIFEAIWWGIPTILIAILSVVTWNSSHSLDPYKSISSSKPTLKIQVVSMNWKWLFIYPKSQIASVNDLTIPVDTPIDLEMTSDGPMNQIWIPQLAGQIMLMPGMVTHLNLISDNTGSYLGRSSNISGVGFAGMTFNTNVVNSRDYSAWINNARKSTKVLNNISYKELNIPSEYVPVSYYSYASHDVFGDIYNKYMSSNNDNMYTGMGN
ncbi:MAG: COX aromatic rich motif-containing protein [Candidatus Saccharibacteria bacterium]